MMRGHYAYYGITGNYRRLSWYTRQVATIWQKWLARRDRMSWDEAISHAASEFKRVQAKYGRNSVGGITS
jgi:predicted molibdopterin-dependent oxidoreductase YjgC